MAKTITTLSDAIAAALSCGCPHCGSGRLFAGLLKSQPRCESAGSISASAKSKANLTIADIKDNDR
jgi:uncharacterized protein (DUF983 family)